MVSNSQIDIKLAAKEIFLAGVERVLPDTLIKKAITLRGNILLTDEFSFNLDTFGRIYLIGAGKASALMGKEIEGILGDRLTDGHIVVKHGHSCTLRKISVSEAGHPVPDADSFNATHEIVKIADMADKNDLVICLLSGGGSALMADFPEGSSAGEIMVVNDLLVNSGCTIKEANTVRKHLSKVKGGQLARRVYPATLLSFILSDVIGDPLDVIASGPAVPDPTTYGEALLVLENHGITNAVPAGIIEYLIKGSRAVIPETPKQGDPVFTNTYNFLIGNNLIALEAAKEKAVNLGFNSEIISDRIQGDLFAAAGYIVDLALERQNDETVSKPVCLLFGGEPTVKVSGNGKGGRNQHLALYCSLLLKEHHGITVLSAGTDGTDGPTPAAGAVADCSTYPEAVAGQIIPENFLSAFDSYNFFKQTGGHIITGPTMTNVMDIIVVLVN
jgi:glycerate 2-kinase